LLYAPIHTSHDISRTSRSSKSNVLQNNLVATVNRFFIGRLATYQ